MMRPSLRPALLARLLSWLPCGLCGAPRAERNYPSRGNGSFSLCLRCDALIKAEMREGAGEDRTDVLHETRVSQTATAA